MGYFPHLPQQFLLKQTPYDVKRDCAVTDYQMYQADQGWINYHSEEHIPETAGKTMETSLLPGDVKAN